jgi:XTP/dITP diphosphohydrolase
LTDKSRGRGHTVVFATRNRKKVGELRVALAARGSSLEVVALDEIAPDAPEVVEDAPTFAGNAEKKARAAHALTGLAAVADDSGLEVDALGGAPGVFSARYAGAGHDDEANNAKLLRELAAVAGEDLARRTARFRCALAYVGTDGALIEADGTVEGRIALAARGAGGFGYDPLFLVEDGEGGGGGRTMAELSPEEKTRISHRGRAVARLLAELATRGRLA